MKILNYYKESDALYLQTSKGRMKLQPFRPNIVRVVYTVEDAYSKKDSLMVVSAPESFNWEVRETPDAVILLTEAVQIRIDKETSAFTYLDQSGNLLAKEPKRGGKTLVPIDVEKYIYDQNVKIEVGQSVDGARVKAEGQKKVIDRKAYHTKIEFTWDQDEGLYGLGSHEEGVFNLRGTNQYLYQQNMKAVVPVLVSTKGYGILLDSYSLMTFHDDHFGSYLWTDVDDEMDFYFIFGGNFDGVVKGIRHLTGKVPMLPKWSFGYVQSKERYKSQEELIAVVKEYRERKIPLDCIVLDWRSWTGELWGQKSFDPERFPDPAEMMKELHDLNAKLMVSIWPIMSNNGPNHLEMQKNNLLLGNQSTYDAFQERARQAFWKQANEGLFSHGIDAWWCDCTEPFESDWTGTTKPEPEERMLINTEEAKKYLDPEYINAYSLLHSRGIYEGQRNTTDLKRVVNLTRSAYAGQQRYGTITWSGDISANWDTLKKQIAAGLNFCITGGPYWTLDIGAFFVFNKEQWFWDGHYNQGTEDLGYRELYLRWLQFGTFLPMFRSHGTDTPREVWQFGEPGTIFYDSLVKFIQLRYRMLPYIYSLAGWVTQYDYTMMRALPFDFHSDVKTFDISDQYMFGPAFMVNPITEPMYYEANSQSLYGKPKTRSVYLPEGNKWYDFWSGRSYGGGRSVEVDAPLDIMPLFVRAGSIVPLGANVQHSGEKAGSPLEIRVYPGNDSIFSLYEDEGDSYRYEQGAFSLITFRWNNETRRLVIDDQAGSYQGMQLERTFHIVLVHEGNGIGLSEAVTDRSVDYKGSRMVIDFIKN